MYRASIHFIPARDRPKVIKNIDISHMTSNSRYLELLIGYVFIPAKPWLRRRSAYIIGIYACLTLGHVGVLACILHMPVYMYIYCLGYCFICSELSNFEDRRCL